MSDPLNDESERLGNYVERTQHILRLLIAYFVALGFCIYTDRLVLRRIEDTLRVPLLQLVADSDPGAGWPGSRWLDSVYHKSYDTNPPKFSEARLVREFEIFKGRHPDWWKSGDDEACYVVRVLLTSDSDPSGFDTELWKLAGTCGHWKASLPFFAIYRTKSENGKPDFVVGVPPVFLNEIDLETMDLAANVRSEFEARIRPSFAYLERDRSNNGWLVGTNKRWEDVLAANKPVAQGTIPWGAVFQDDLGAVRFVKLSHIKRGRCRLLGEVTAGQTIPHDFFDASRNGAGCGSGGTNGEFQTSTRLQLSRDIPIKGLILATDTIVLFSPFALTSMLFYLALTVRRMERDLNQNQNAEKNIIKLLKPWALSDCNKSRWAWIGRIYTALPLLAALTAVFLHVLACMFRYYIDKQIKYGQVDFLEWFLDQLQGTRASIDKTAATIIGLGVIFLLFAVVSGWLAMKDLISIRRRLKA